MTHLAGFRFLVLTRPEAFLPTPGDQASVFLQPCIHGLVYMTVACKGMIDMFPDLAKVVSFSETF